jgi:hypothetical protein
VLEDRRPSALRPGLKLGIAALIIVAGLPIALDIAGVIDGLRNPFASERTERVDPAVVTALQELDELHAASAELQVVVEVDDDTRYLPDALSGRNTTFLAAGSVDAVVELGDATVTEQPDGTVTVVLPQPTLDDPTVDHETSRVLDRDRGLFDRMADAVGEGPDEADVYRLAADSLSDAAAETDLLEEAEQSAAQTVEDLFEDAGIEDVKVEFAAPPSGI